LRYPIELVKHNIHKVATYPGPVYTQNIYDEVHPIIWIMVIIM